MSAGSKSRRALSGEALAWTKLVDVDSNLLAKDEQGDVQEIPLIEAWVSGAWVAWRIGGGATPAQAKLEWEGITPHDYGAWCNAAAEHAASEQAQGDDSFGALAYFAAAHGHMGKTVRDVLRAYVALPHSEQARYVAACQGARRAAVAWKMLHNTRWNGVAPEMR